MNNLTLPFLWVLNGTLAAVYTLAEHGVAITLVVPLAWLLINLRRLAGRFYQPEYHAYLATSSAISVLAAVLAPTPVPFFLLVMAVAGVVALVLERYNPAQTYWSIIGGLGLYSLIGIGFAVMQVYLLAVPPMASQPGIGAFLVQGQGYLGVLVAFGIYGYPIGYLALLAKGLFIHPPTGRPEELIEYGRTRNWRN
jgi:hypothetical protein